MIILINVRKKRDTAEIKYWYTLTADFTCNRFFYLLMAMAGGLQFTVYIFCNLRFYI